MTLGADTIAAVEYEIVKAGWGAAGSINQTAVAAPLPIRQSDGTNSLGTFHDLDTGVGTEFKQGVSLRISASGGSIEAKAQQAMASSIPVVVASDQTAFPVSQSGTWNVGTVTTVSTVTSLSQFAGVGIALNTGLRTAGTLRVTVATDDIVPASQSGTWNIGTVTTVTTVTSIGTSVTPGTAAGNLGKAEDAAHASGDTGVMLLGVRQGVPVDLSAGNTNGDYEPIQVDAVGRVWARTPHQGTGTTVPVYSIHVPAANTQATISKAAAGIGIRNVCIGFTVMLVATATAPTAVNIAFNLIDGASAGTTYLWRATISLVATAGASNGIVNLPCWFEGTANTALTLEASAAGGANTIESVAMTTITIAE